MKKIISIIMVFVLAISSANLLFGVNVKAAGQETLNYVMNAQNVDTLKNNGTLHLTNMSYGQTYPGAPNSALHYDTLTGGSAIFKLESWDKIRAIQFVLNGRNLTDQAGTYLKYSVSKELNGTYSQQLEMPYISNAGVSTSSEIIDTNAYNSNVLYLKLEFNGGQNNYIWCPDWSYLTNLAVTLTTESNLTDYFNFNLSSDVNYTFEQINLLKDNGIIMLDKMSIGQSQASNNQPALLCDKTGEASIIFKFSYKDTINAISLSLKGKNDLSKENTYIKYSVSGSLAGEYSMPISLPAITNVGTANSGKIDTSFLNSDTVYLKLSFSSDGNDSSFFQGINVKIMDEPSEIAVNQIILPSNINCDKGSLLTLPALFLPLASNQEKYVKWSSSDNSIVSVSDSGFIRANNYGEATISAALKSNPKIKSTCIINVGQKNNDQSFFQTPDWIQLYDRADFKFLNGTNYYYNSYWMPNRLLTTGDGLHTDINHLFGNHKDNLYFTIDLGKSLPVSYVSFKQQSGYNERFIKLFDVYLSDTPPEYRDAYKNNPQNTVITSDLGKPIYSGSFGDISPKERWNGKAFESKFGRYLTIRVSDNYGDAHLSISEMTIGHERAQVENISLENKTIENTTSEVLLPVLSPTDAYAMLEWSSSNPLVAKVDNNGKVTAMSAGTAEITVTSDSGKSATCIITVPEIDISDIKLNYTKATFACGSEYPFIVSYFPKNTTGDKTVSWSSSNPEVATVDSNGVVKIVSVSGTAIITAKVGDKSAVCKVTATFSEMDIGHIISTSFTEDTIFWNQIKGADGYEIFYATSIDGEYSLLATIDGGSITSHKNFDLPNNIAYFYKMRAFAFNNDNRVYSQFSQSIAYKAVPDLIKCTLENNEIIITWSPIDGANGYEISRSSSIMDEYSVIGIMSSSDELMLKDTEIFGGQTYFYKIRSFMDIDGEKIYGTYSHPIPVRNLIVDGLKCFALNEAKGVDDKNIEFSWKIKCANNDGMSQSAYQIAVFNKGTLVFDSGKVESSNSQSVIANINSLQSSTKYTFKVKIWDELNNESPWSYESYFITGIFNATEWGSSKFISANGISGINVYSDTIWFRKDFNIDALPDSSIIHVACVGSHELYVNGQKIGDRVLAPSRSKIAGYSRVLYNTYDITQYLRKGANTIGIWSDADWARDAHVTPSFKSILLLDSGGSIQRIVSDSSWKCNKSNIKHINGFHWGNFGGEQITGDDNNSWSISGVNQTGWNSVTEERISTTITPDLSNGDTIIEEFKPVSITKQSANKTLIDMGKNYTGWIRINFKDGVPNQKVNIKIADKKTEEVSFEQISEYIFTNSNGTFCNKFNYFAGRYITIEGTSQTFTNEDVTGLVLGSNFEKTASFTSSNELLNKIYEVDVNTYVANTLNGISMDCPHRERLGYGETNVSTVWGIGLHNFDTTAYYRQLARNWRDVQYDNGYIPHVTPNSAGGGGTTWSSSLTISLDDYYKYSADKKALEDNFEAVTKWADYLVNNIQNNLLQRYSYEGFHFLGDWATPEGDDWGDSENALFFNNCVAIYVLDKTAQFAGILGETDLQQKYEEVVREMRKSVHAKYYDTVKKIYRNGEQRYIAIALCAGIVPENELPYVLDSFTASLENKTYFDGGSAGLVFIYRAAGEILQRPDLMYKILNNTSKPGYGYFIQQGQNTWPELWDMSDTYGGSRIHTCYTGIAGVITRYFLGITPQNGMKDFLIKPFIPSDMDYMKSTNDYGYGDIVIEWERIDDVTIQYNITLPENTNAYFTAPDGYAINDNDIEAYSLSLRSGKNTVILTKSVPLYLISHNKRVVNGYDANIKVEVVSDKSFEDRPIKVYLEGSIEDSVVVDKDGFAIIPVPKEQTANNISFRIVAATLDDTIYAYDEIEIIKEPENLWNPIITKDGETVYIKFASDIYCKGSVKINGISYNPELLKSDTLVINGFSDDVTGKQITISGIKFPELFPSFSFKFNKIVGS